MKGLNSKAPNALETDPPKHVHSLLGQASNFITMISQEIHGACGAPCLVSENHRSRWTNLLSA